MPISKHLQEAIDSLHIQDVYVRSFDASSVNGFDPKSEDDVSTLRTQHMHFVEGYELAIADETVNLFRVVIKLGVRWVDDVQQDEEHPEGVDVKAQLEAQFVAEYEMGQHLSDDCLNEFASKNASYHVWPYWREFLSSQSERMRLPRVTVPAVQFSKPQESKPVPVLED